jgi:pyrroline-5-carboxylate reductase
MGSAILSGILNSCNRAQESGVVPLITRFIACVHSKASAERLKTRYAEYSDCLTIYQSDNLAGMKEADIALLACKPYMAETVLGAEGVPEALQGKLVISVLSGTPPDKLRGIILGQDPLPEAAKNGKFYITRAMPNIAAEFQQSMTVLDDTEGLPAKMMETTQWIFNQVGKTSIIPPDLAAISGILAGASPAFLTVALDGILDGAVSQGLKRAEAKKFMIQCLAGLVHVLEDDDNLERLREKISSPRGTTIEGLLCLEENGVRTAFSKAVIAGTKRSKGI